MPSQLAEVEHYGVCFSSLKWGRCPAFPMHPYLFSWQ